MFNGQCLPSGQAAISQWCSSNYPKTETVDGQLVVLGCVAADDTHATITRTSQGEETPANNPTWTTDNMDDPDAPAVHFAGGDTADSACSAALSWVSTWGTPGTCSVTSPSAISFTGTSSQLWHFTSTCTGCAVPAGPQSTEQSVSLPFPPCDAAEQYSDMVTVWALALVACTLVWVAKNFLYRLVANQ